MSTRSNIAIKNADDTISVIYCHFDGYPSFNGRILLEHYKDEAKIRQLIELGDISILGPEIGSKVDFNNPPWLEGEKIQNVTQCLAYGRDRGEKGTEARKVRLAKFFPREMEEYFYYWTEGKWFFSDHEGPLQELNEKNTQGRLSKLGN